MIVVSLVIFIVMTLAPGFLAVRLLRKRLHPINAVVYAIGLGLLFNILVGLTANFTSELNLVSVGIVFVGYITLLSVASFKYGSRVSRWRLSKGSIIPIGIYLLAITLQLQTSLVSSNLVGSDIHLEYFVANRVLEQGLWNPLLSDTIINSSLGITILLPLYSLITRMELLWVFKIISPLIFAFLPVVLYRIFKMQFGTMVAILSVLFFITMPMFTMDMVQAIRHQQSELFFILVVLVLLDNRLPILLKVVLGAFFSIGAVTTHYGLPIGFTGYLLISSVVVILLARFWRKKRWLLDINKPMLPRMALVIVGMVALISYIGYYSVINEGQVLRLFGGIPATIVEDTVKQANIDVTETVTKTPLKITDSAKPSTFNQLWREPLLQTSIGLDFTKASNLGKMWRVLQYLVEICLVVGFFVLLFKPGRKIKLEYMAFVITSFFVIAGMYLLATYSYGLGAARTWQVSLLFMSPLFVIGAGTIGGCLFRNKVFNQHKVVLFSTLALFIPYFIFNSGIVFEVAKLKPVGFIDVPYSIALSSSRVDIASVFDKEDVEAVAWLKQFGDSKTMYGDAHGTKLLIQYFGVKMVESTRSLRGDIRVLNKIGTESVGYIFLRKWNLDTNQITVPGDYGSRISYNLDEMEVAKGKIQGGTVIFDNGARIISINE